MNKPCDKILYEVSGDENEAFRIIEWHCNTEDNTAYHRILDNTRVVSIPKDRIDKSKGHGVYSSKGRAESERKMLITKRMHEHRQQIAHSKRVLHKLTLAMRGE